MLLLVYGFGLYILHFSVTNYKDFAQDMEGHEPYLKSVAAGHLPLPDDCWECFQPPLYYALGGGVYAAAAALGLNEPMGAVRCLSLIFYAVYLAYALRLLRENISWQPGYYVALALVIFWPIGVTKATLISNDVPLFAAETAGFYYLQRWWRTLRQRDVLLALACTALAMNFKSSGMVLAAAIGACVGWRCWRKRLPWRALVNRRFLLFSAVFAFVALLPTARLYYDLRIVHPGDESLISSHVHQLANWLALDDKLHYYVSFDYETYATRPFFSTGENQDGRYYFWNSLLKNALFGEFQWKPKETALVLAMAELGMVIYMLLTLAWLALNDAPALDALTPPLFFIGLQLASLIAYRATYPFACNQDYRYIYASTPVLALLYINASQWWGGGMGRPSRPILAYFGVGLGAGFAMLASAFIVLQDI